MADKKYKTKILLVYSACYPPTGAVTEEVTEYDIGEVEKAVRRYEEIVNHRPSYDNIEIKFVRKEERLKGEEMENEERLKVEKKTEHRILDELIVLYEKTKNLTGMLSVICEVISSLISTIAEVNFKSVEEKEKFVKGIVEKITDVITESTLFRVKREENN